jgi:hypothetical protein
MTTTAKNAIAADNVLIKLSDLETDRINWETGSYKKSNEELYSILDRCFHLYQDVKGMKEGKRTLIKSIDAILVGRGMAVRKNTSLVTKIVRYVFGDCGKREFVYARVILAADTNKKESQSLHAYIAENRGIEEIRKQGKDGEPSAKEKREKLIEAAEARIATAPSLFSGITLNDELQPDNDNGLDLMVGLMRKDADGTGSIVYRSNNTTTINALLAAWERDANASGHVAAAASAPGKAADERADVIAEEAA